MNEETTAKHFGLQVVVAQLGSRMHYAVPIAFYKSDILALLITDISSMSSAAYIAKYLPSKFLPRSMRRLLGRIPFGLPPRVVREFPIFGLCIGLLRQLSRRLNQIDAAYIWIGRAFARRASRHLPANCNCIYGFNGASLELFRSPRAGEALKVLEQTMAPRFVEDRLLREAYTKFPKWASHGARRSNFWRPKLYERESQEWAAADIIVCGSKFVVDGIAEAGGPVEKCAVVPYAVDPSRFSGRERKLQQGKPINILFVGSVGLRKGAPLVLETAKALGADAHVRMVGAIEVPRDAEQQLREHVELSGAVPRSEMISQFEWADLLLLPSFCEGSATVTYEAMASGLPQILTSNAGSYVADHKEGLIVPSGDVEGIVSAVRYYRDNPQSYNKASVLALETIRTLTIEEYSKRLINLVAQNVEGDTSGPRSLD